MRTKTLALSAMLGLLGSAAVMAANVYSVNTVGYINVTLYPGFNIITDPLIASPDNTLNTVLNNTPNIGGVSPYSGATVYQFINGSGFGANDVGNPGSFGGGWGNGGSDVTLNPGQGVFFLNPNPIGGANMTATFVGTVPQNSTPVSANFAGMSQTMFPGYNLVGSIVPITGDLVAATPAAFTFAQSGDFVYFFDPTPAGPVQNGYESANAFTFSSWTPGSGVNSAPNGDPLTLNPAQGFWYNDQQAGNETWTESFTVNP